MKEFVDHHIRTFHTCQRVKSERKSSRGKIQPFLIPERKWQAIHMDWVLGLPPWPPNVGTYEAVLTITDRATKMVHFVVTSRIERQPTRPDTSSSTCSKPIGYRAASSATETRNSSVCSDNLSCSSWEFQHILPVGSTHKRTAKPKGPTRLFDIIPW